MVELARKGTRFGLKMRSALTFMCFSYACVAFTGSSHRPKSYKY